MKKAFCVLLTLTIFALTGCREESESTDKKEKDTVKNPIVQDIETGNRKNAESDSLEIKEAMVQYAGVEEANEGLSEEENVWLVLFEYTNKAEEPKEFQDYFELSYFQNNVELDEITSWSSSGGEHYKLMGNYFDETMQGGTINFADGIILQDNSPITVFIKTRSSASEEKMTSFTINITEPVEKNENEGSGMRFWE